MTHRVLMIIVAIAMLGLFASSVTQACIAVFPVEAQPHRALPAVDAERHRRQIPKNPQNSNTWLTQQETLIKWFFEDPANPYQKYKRIPKKFMASEMETLDWMIESIKTKRLASIIFASPKLQIKNDLIAFRNLLEHSDTFELHAFYDLAMRFARTSGKTKMDAYQMKDLSRVVEVVKKSSLPILIKFNPRATSFREVNDLHAALIIPVHLSTKTLKVDGYFEPPPDVSFDVLNHAQRFLDNLMSKYQHRLSDVAFVKWFLRSRLDRYAEFRKQVAEAANVETAEALEIAWFDLFFNHGEVFHGGMSREEVMGKSYDEERVISSIHGRAKFEWAPELQHSDTMKYEHMSDAVNLIIETLAGGMAIQR